MRSFVPVRPFTSCTSEWSVPENTRTKLMRPTWESATVLKA